MPVDLAFQTLIVYFQQLQSREETLAGALWESAVFQHRLLEQLRTVQEPLAEPAVSIAVQTDELRRQASAIQSKGYIYGGIITVLRCVQRYGYNRAGHRLGRLLRELIHSFENLHDLWSSETQDYWNRLV